MSSKNRVFLITALVYILYTLFPLFGDVIGIPVWLPSIATFSVMFVLYPKAFSNRTFGWFVVYALILACYFLTGRPLSIGIGSVGDGKKLLIEYAFILPTVSIFSILAFIRDNEITDKLIKWSVLILYVSFIVAVPLMLQYNSIREAMSIENNEAIRIPGLPSYSLMHAYILFLPVLCYSVRIFSGKNRLLALLGLLALCFVIYDTFVSTSLALMIVVLFFTFIHSDKNSSMSWIVIFILGFVFFILYETGFFMSIIDWMMPAFEGTAVEPKLVDIKESMIQGHLTGSSITGRQDHHAASIDAFLQNPILGGSHPGSHSSLMDRFGGMGIITGIPFVMIIFSFIKRMSRFYHTRMARTFFWVGILVGLVFLYHKGNWGCESWLFYFVLMPMGLLTVENRVKKTHHNR